MKFKDYDDRIEAKGMAEIRALSRERYPHRYAADGTPLIRFAGSSWAERLMSARSALSSNVGTDVVVRPVPYATPGTDPEAQGYLDGSAVRAGIVSSPVVPVVEGNDGNANLTNRRAHA